jgi:hypothetical protein
MEVLRHLRPERVLRTRVPRGSRACIARHAMVLTLAALVATGIGCAGTQTSAAPLRPVTLGVQWPVKAREHVDLWLHGFALLLDDTAAVPLFERGYSDRMTVLKNSRNVYTDFDANRVALTATLKARPALEGAQFLALYFGSWDELRQAFDYFQKAEGDPAKATNREVQGIVAFLAQGFPRAEDREFARRFVDALESERAKFFHQWWIEEQRARSSALAAADSLWQKRWRPALQSYLNHTQQPNGDLIVSLALGGEGRSVPAGKTESQYAVAWPRTADSADVMLFSFVHEAVGAVAQVAVNDNLTPAQQRAGAGTRLAGTSLVRGGALLMEHLDPALAERYARWYLQQSGLPVPASDALGALALAFPMPAEMVTSMRRQIDLAFGGI